MYTNINLLNGWVNPRVTLRDIHINFRSVSDRISVVIFRFGAITDKPSQMSWAPYGCMLSPMGLTEHWAPFFLNPLGRQLTFPYEMNVAILGVLPAPYLILLVM